MVLDYPEPGSKFTPIACPENCYALIPTEAVYSFGIVHRKTPPNYKEKAHPINRKVEPLIDGEPADGQYLTSKNALLKGTQVWVRGEKTIMINGKPKTYCIILTSGKDVRYVHSADLEGVQESVPQTPPPSNTFQMNQPTVPFNSSPNTTWPPVEPIKQSAYETEQLPAEWLTRVQAAEQAYQAGMRNGVWEDARMRYQQLLESDVVSVRILAKNRLEFIREWQQSPPVQASSRLAETGYPIMSSGPWIPGEVAARLPRQPAVATSQPAPVRDTVVRPAYPVPTNIPVTSSPAVAGNPATTMNQGRPTSPLDIPVYPGNGVQAQPTSPPPGVASVQPQQPVSSPPPAVNPQRLPQQPVTAPAPQKINTVGKLNRTVQYTGANPLFYLTNSAGTMTYYVRGNQLIRLERQNVRIEGTLTQVPIDGKLQNLIQVEKVEPLR